jgi:uncharacterized damage-inducible protein DinB
MVHFLEYKWQIRDELLDVCNAISNRELYEKRIGGIESFAARFFHVRKLSMIGFVI